jgi:hypothetical protein
LVVAACFPSEKDSRSQQCLARSACLAESFMKKEYGLTAHDTEIIGKHFGALGLRLKKLKVAVMAGHLRALRRPQIFGYISKRDLPQASLKPFDVACKSTKLL